MKAITLHQPWAWAIWAGWKFHETRSWWTSYRGPLLIHAGKVVDWKFSGTLSEIGGDIDHVTGAIVARCDLVACELIDSGTHGLTDRENPREWDGYLGNWEPGRYAWELENIVIIDPPVECRGYQGLWTPSDEILEKVAA